MELLPLSTMDWNLILWALRDRIKTLESRDFMRDEHGIAAYRAVYDRLVAEHGEFPIAR
jgi:hypothetical protein